MIPLALVTGFLGAGKTTYLAHLARRYGPRRVAFLVNEFAGTDIDSPQLSPLSELVIGVCGGSIFCRCKAEEFINRLTGVANAFPDLAGVVVEASGMADPGAARQMLEESGLDRTYDWRGCIALADPGSLTKVLDTLAAAEKQIAAADVVLLNKCDLYAETALAACEQAIRAIHPTVRIERTVQSASALDPLELHSDRWVDGALAACADPGVVAVEAPLSAAHSLDLIASGLEGLGDGLLRAKGFHPGADGWTAIDWAGGRIHRRPGIAGPPRLVLLVRPLAAFAARAFATRLATA